MGEDSYFGDMGGDYSTQSDNDAIGITTAVEQTTGSKNSLFSGLGRGVSVGMYQWLIVVGAVVLLWAFSRGLGKALTS